MEIPGWHELDQQLTRRIEFRDFSEAFAFISRVALIAEVHQHHPDWSNSYGVVTIRLSTHDQNNQITQKDYDLALAINGILRE
jgi:4a-hydroxytetrahydrobiopterin dehydratase|tara:strand:- start:177 stop:425 length:249 start_codon:yes stop_codon:yes gene_type:complete